MLRVDGPDWARLHAFLRETLALPEAWPPSSYSFFATAGVQAGNVNLEVVRFGAREKEHPTGARLYGIAFEPASTIEEAVRELRRRGLRRGPITPGRDPASGRLLWRNAFIGRLLDGGLAEAGLYAAMHAAPRSMIDRPNPDLMLGASTIGARLFERAVRRGLTFLVEYEPDMKTERVADGGSLGLTGVAAVLVGARDRASAVRRWQALLDPIAPSGDGEWAIGDGPALRLVDGDDGLVGLELRVASLARAREFLRSRSLLGEGDTINRSAALGLELRIV